MATCVTNGASRERHEAAALVSRVSRLPRACIALTKSEEKETACSLISLLKNDTYSRPECSDLYSLSWRKLLENHTLHSATYLYIPYRTV